jgi:hypothetical protein
MKFIHPIQEPKEKPDLEKGASRFGAEHRCKSGRQVGRVQLMLMIVLTCAVAFAAMPAPAATLTVTSTGDTIAVDGLLTLREAITSANNNANVNSDVIPSGAYGTDTIQFLIPGSGVKTITPTSTLPSITDPLTIDGYTQPGSSANTLTVGDNAVLRIQLTGSSSVNGLVITGGNSTIRGLVINGFGGVSFTDAGITLHSDNNVVEGCFIGVDPTGTMEHPNVFSGGVFVNTGADNLIGGTTPGARNLISGNTQASVATGNVTIQQIFGSGDPPPVGTLVRGNYIGTDASGTVAIHPEAFQNTVGVAVRFGTDTIIGGADADDGATDENVAARNLISGNSEGISVGGGMPVDGLTIKGNFIGVDASGTSALQNFGIGIEGNNSIPGVTNLTIGGTAPGAGNVISGNGLGIELSVLSATILGNLIGTDVTGMQALGNGSDGVHLGFGGTGSPDIQVTVGGTTAAARNVISANTSSGLYITGLESGRVTVQGNYIGVACDGLSALGNQGAGVLTNRPASLGGDLSGAGNVIAQNLGTGVSVTSGSNGIDTVAILGNSIYGNGGLGIDLGGNGVNLNDPGDTDSGPNNVQNFPVITAATFTGSNVEIVGTFNSIASTTFHLEFFGNQVADPAGFGEGQSFLGSTDVTTDGSGNATFDVTLSFPAGVQSLSATATDPDGNTSEFSQAFEAVAPPPPSRLLNISTRLRVLTDNNVLIGGFIITGETPKKVIIRAIGPSLGELGLSGVLADPILELHESDDTVVTNDNWKGTQEAEIEATGLQPSNDLESAIVATLDPGPYTAIVSGKNSGTGIALVEAYDLDQTLGPILANISTRGFVDTGDNVMIGGFIVGPTGSGDLNVLIRAIGPSLTDFGIDNPLLDPLLELHDSNGATLTTNDNWKDSQQAEIEATGLAPTNNSESAILQTLAPGGYTAIVRGVGDTTGVGLVEVYNLPNAP